MKKLDAPIQRLGYTPPEAAAAVGVGPDFFDEWIAPHLDVVRLGNKRIYPVASIERFLAAQAEAPMLEQLEGSAR